ncbi:sigma 54-interacting transcriptional regulator [Candidatus Magnetaquicoccus inordinatus]|uniref:sigma 54-interacting transcriptional regulator n=1 Tax=Candidatus Magnetaquicoccus inordinatus TaxID=2496818 RepID=UPI00102AF7F2|nr:sigma 54-interacting transcriptional regulator [Candidatus Magnetaquicoccus inordinatus]
MGKILVIDDDLTLGRLLTRMLRGAGHEVRAESSWRVGMEVLTAEAYDLVYCDVRLQQEFGLDLLPKIATLPLPPLVIIITGHPSLETAQQAMREGAFDYLVKPILEEALLRSVNRALAAKRFQTERENVRLHLQAVLHTIDEALFSISCDWQVRSANQKAQQLCGIVLAENGEEPLCLPQHCHGACTEALRAALQGEQMTLLRQRCQRPHAPERVVSLTATPLTDISGHLLGALLAIKDETQVVQLENAVHGRARWPGLVGQSVLMQQLYRKIEQVAEVETTVLLSGESGTGKELVVEAIHQAGSRSRQPLVRVNCVALSETLLESELFGHVRGAFTGAVRDRVGRFQEAHRGTIFLDEIGDISPAMQMRLLRVLQEKSFERVGENRPCTVDVRIVAATNQNLAAMVENNRFRADLYYRLRVVEINLPPLRQRREDIPLLVAYFIREFNERFGKRIGGVSEGVLHRFMHYHWPGNVRQLRHTIEHAFVVCNRTEIDVPHLPEWADQERGGAEVVTAEVAAEGNLEQQTILNALVANRWHRDKAAQQLGMSRSTFYRRLKQFGLDASDG